MRKWIYIALLGMLTWPAAGFGQLIKHYDLISEMNGLHTLDDGSIPGLTLPFWGFGYFNSEGPSVITLPGPLITAKQGDSLKVKMSNPSHEGHTIHFHGLDVDQENDGVPATSDFVQQHQSRTYSFLASHAGNYLYHCHVTTTLHLTMGMYGVVVVYPSDSSSRPYDGGPLYQEDYTYLFSELDSDWNADYTAIGSFVNFNPDYYLVNGVNKNLIYQDSAQVISGQAGDDVLLRLLNVGYLVNRVIFPSNLDAEVLMSDGRVLPQSFTADTLFLYPGERYSVMGVLLNSDSSYVIVDYLDPYQFEFLGRDYIPVNSYDFEYVEHNLGTPMPSAGDEPLKIFPNPASDAFTLINPFGEPIRTISVMDASGKLVRQFNSPDPGLIHQVQIGFLARGSYIVQVESNSGQVRSTILLRQ